MTGPTFHTTKIYLRDTAVSPNLKIEKESSFAELSVWVQSGGKIEIKEKVSVYGQTNIWVDTTPANKVTIDRECFLSDLFVWIDSGVTDKFRITHNNPKSGGADLNFAGENGLSCKTRTR